MQQRTKNVLKIGCFLATFLFVLLMIPTQNVKAGEKLSSYTTDYQIKVGGSNRVPAGQYGSFEILNENYIEKTYGAGAKYQWYVSHKNVVDDYGWYKVDDKVLWMWGGDTKHLLFYLQPGFAYENDSDVYLIKCMIIGSNGKKAITTEEEIHTGEGTTVKKVSVLSETGSLNPVYGEKISFKFSKEVEDAEYEIALRKNQYEMDHNQGVQWYKWDDDTAKWTPKHQGAYFEAGTYKLKINLTTSMGWVFDPGLVNGTQCYLNNKKMEREFNAYNYSEMAIVRIFNVKEDDNPRMMKLGKDVGFYESNTGNTPKYMIPAGATIKIMDFSETWIKIVDPDGKTGWVKSSELFDEMEYHWYVCTANALNVRETPEKTGTRVSSLKYGDIVYVEKRNEGWMQIKSSANGSVIGWASGLYLEMTPEPPYAIPPKTGVVNVNALTVRCGAGSSYERIGGLTQGYEVMVTGRKVDTEGRGWLIFNYNGELGYVMEQYLSCVGAETTAKKTLLVHIPVGVPGSISTTSEKYVFTPIPETVINIEDITIDSNMEGIVSFRVAPEDGYSFPSDVKEIKVNLGENPEFSLLKIEKQKDGSVIVYLRDINYCEKYGHQYETGYTVDRKATLDRAGSKSKHCEICDQKSSVKKISRIKTLTIYKGQKMKIATSKKASKWKSSNKKCVKISKSGVIVGKKAGKATIKAKIKGKTYSCKVTVKKRKK